MLTKVSNSLISGSYANAYDFGMRTTASADENAAALQAAVKSGSTVVVVPPGEYSFNPKYALYDDGTFQFPAYCGAAIPSNVTLIGYGVRLIGINTNSPQYSFLASYRTQNVNIKGFYLRGDRDSNTWPASPPQDYGFGVDFREVENCSVEDVASDKMYGDSFYCGVIDVNLTGSRAVTYRNISGWNSRRQGLSITGGSQIIVDGYRFYSIRGASQGPCAGIDIEPNTGDLVDDVIITNGYVEDCAMPIVLYKTINLVVSNLQSENCDISFPRLNDRVFDAVFDNIVGRAGNNTDYGILWQLSRTIERVRFNNFIMVAPFLYNFYIEEDQTGSYAFDDVVFSNGTFLVADAEVFTNYSETSAFGAITFDSCKLVVPAGFSAGDTGNLDSSSYIISTPKAIWKNCLLENKGTASLQCNFGVHGNQGNIVTGMTFIEDYATLNNSWANLSGYQQPAIIKDASGEVRLYGTIEGGTTSASTSIATMPVGFRPAQKETCVIAVENGSGTVTASMVEISTAGEITLLSTVPTNAKLTLNGIRYLA
jgi:hypothetical protein